MPECQVDQVGNDRNRQILAEDRYLPAASFIANTGLSAAGNDILNKAPVFTILIASGRFLRRNPLRSLCASNLKRGDFFSHILDSHYVGYYASVTPILHTLVPQLCLGGRVYERRAF